MQARVSVSVRIDPDLLSVVQAYADDHCGGRLGTAVELLRAVLAASR